MKDDDKVICADCKHYNFVRWAGDKSVGQCRFNPPVVVPDPDTGGETRFPSVDGGWWCGKAEGDQ